MAIAYVRDLGKIRTTGTGLASSASFGTAPAVGNHVISMISCYKGGDTTYSMTTSDNKSNSYSNAVTARDPYSGGETISNIASAKVATSSGTFTVTATASGSGVAYHTWSAAEFSGLHATTWLDRTGSNNGAIGTNALAITVTTSANLTAADELAISVWAPFSGTNHGSIAAATGYSIVFSEGNTTTYMGGAGAYKVISGGSGATHSAAWTWTSNADGVSAVIATFIPAAGGGSSYDVSATDSITAGDSASQTLTIPASGADNVSASEVATQLATLPAAASQAVAITDSATNLIAAGAAASDGASAADVATQTVTIPASGSDAASAADAASSASAVASAATDAVSVADVSTQLAVLPASAVDSVAVVDAATQTAVMPAAATDATSAADVSAAQQTIPVASADAASASDVATQDSAAGVSAVDSVSAADVAMIQSVLVGIAQETVAASDAASLLAGVYNVSVEDLLNLLDSATAAIEGSTITPSLERTRIIEAGNRTRQIGIENRTRQIDAESRTTRQS